MQSRGEDKGEKGSDDHQQDRHQKPYLTDYRVPESLPVGLPWQRSQPPVAQNSQGQNQHKVGQGILAFGLPEGVADKAAQQNQSQQVL